MLLKCKFYQLSYKIYFLTPLIFITISLTCYLNGIYGNELISTYYYDETKRIAIFELKGHYNKVINNMLIIDAKSSSISTNVTYDQTFKTRIINLFRTTISENNQTNRINLHINGDSVPLEKNTEELKETFILGLQKDGHFKIGIFETLSSEKNPE